MESNKCCRIWNATKKKKSFHFRYHKSTTIYKRLKKQDKISWLDSDGTIAKAFPVKETNYY